MQAFDAVARLGGVAAAAQELAVTSGAISQQLRRIEAVLGRALFVRQGAGLRLTPDGLRYHEAIAPAFAQLRRAHERPFGSQRAGVLVLSALSSVAIRWLGPRMFEWQAIHPDARVRLIGAEAEPALDADGEVDFRLCYGPAGHHPDRRTVLYDDQVVPAMSPSLAARGPLARPADLLKRPLIRIEWEDSHGPSPDWQAWARLYAGVARVVQSEPSFSLSSAAIDAAVAGRGVVLAQIALLSAELAAGRLVVPFDLRLPLPESYHLAWSERALAKPHGEALRAWLLEIGRAQGRQATAPLQQAAR